jgi:hypothetical protein
MVLQDLQELQDRVSERVRSADLEVCRLKWVSRVQETVRALIRSGRGERSPAPAKGREDLSVYWLGGS